jgi:hypothetical protein
VPAFDLGLHLTDVKSARLVSARCMRLDCRCSYRMLTGATVTPCAGPPPPVSSCPLPCLTDVDGVINSNTANSGGAVSLKVSWRVPHRQSLRPYMCHAYAP